MRFWLKKSNLKKNLQYFLDFEKEKTFFLINNAFHEKTLFITKKNLNFENT